jgi:hypothetical protein
MYTGRKNDPTKLGKEKNIQQEDISSREIETVLQIGTLLLVLFELCRSQTTLGDILCSVVASSRGLVHSL